jgi:hypothetical protein
MTLQAGRRRSWKTSRLRRKQHPAGAILPGDPGSAGPTADGPEPDQHAEPAIAAGAPVVPGGENGMVVFFPESIDGGGGKIVKVLNAYGGCVSDNVLAGYLEVDFIANGNPPIRQSALAREPRFDALAPVEQAAGQSGINDGGVDPGHPDNSSNRTGHGNLVAQIDLARYGDCPGFVGSSRDWPARPGVDLRQNASMRPPPSLRQPDDANGGGRVSRSRRGALRGFP